MAVSYVTEPRGRENSSAHVNGTGRFRCLVFQLFRQGENLKDGVRFFGVDVTIAYSRTSGHMGRCCVLGFVRRDRCMLMSGILLGGSV